MERLIRKYEGKLIEQGLVCPEGPLLGGIDADLVWNRHDPRITPILEDVFAGLSINSLLFAKPSSGYAALIDRLIALMPPDATALYPQDNESRTFLHDLPIAQSLSADEIIANLERRKCVIIPGEGIVTTGTVTPEQCFIVYSSVLFCLYVKAFVDHYEDSLHGKADLVLGGLVSDLGASYGSMMAAAVDYKPLTKGPMRNTAEAVAAICEVGRLTVEKRMVDSFFGNISYRVGDTIHVTQTTSTLDELEGQIDPCPMDDSTCAGITASTEYQAHKVVYQSSGARAILHGHPKFSVIASMLCDQRDTCENRAFCHTRCSADRRVGDIPIIPGESGSGKASIGATLPPALAANRGAIVYGHGVFTRGAVDFTDAFASLIEIEKMCFDAYSHRVAI